MNTMDFFGSGEYNHLFNLSILLFIAYAVIAIIFRLPSGEHCHAKLNRINALFLALYLMFAAIYCMIHGILDFQAFAAIVGGVFTFITLQQIYFMAVIGLIKKSVSVTILEAAEHGNYNEDEIKQIFLRNTENIRLNRLEQMKFLGLAKENTGTYKITKAGRFFNAFGSLILKIWGLKRL